MVKTHCTIFLIIIAMFGVSKFFGFLQYSMEVCTDFFQFNSKFNFYSIAIKILQKGTSDLLLQLSSNLSSVVLPDSNVSKKQVAQRAMIAHLSPMCQGQMCSFQKGRIKNNREKVETSFSPL